MKVKVSAVSYLNTLPFLHGINNSPVLEKIDLSLDMPSNCARKLIAKEVDLGLVPVAILPDLEEHYVITDYCIGADGPVDTVALYSDVPLEEIKSIYLDYQSKTSVQLVQVLAKNYWNITPNWIDANKDYELAINGNTAGVIIGDRTFNLHRDYKYKYDLSEEWKKFTNQPFVFACWVSNKPLPSEFIFKFNEALKFGLAQIEQIVDLANNAVISKEKLYDYLTQKIDYQFDDLKQQAMVDFQEFLSKNKTLPTSC